MTVQTRLLSLPIVGGLNEKDDSVISCRPQAMTNCVYRKTGAVSKRYGFERIGAYNLDSAAATPPVCESLATFNSELLRLGGGKLHTYGVLNSTTDWLPRGRISECIVEREAIVAAGATSTTHTDPGIAYANGYQISVYVTNAASK